MSEQNEPAKPAKQSGGQPLVAKTRVKIGGKRFNPGDELPALTKAQIAELEAAGSI